MDWQLLQADLVLNLPPPGFSFYSEDDLPKEVFVRLMAVARSLVSLGHFKEAGDLYVDIGRVFPESECVCMAADAFYHAGDDDASLANIVTYHQRIMKSQDNNPDWDNPKYQSSLCSMINTYYCIFQKALVDKATYTRGKVVCLPQQAAEAIGCVAMVTTMVPKVC